MICTPRPGTAAISPVFSLSVLALAPLARLSRLQGRPVPNPPALAPGRLRAGSRMSERLHEVRLVVNDVPRAAAVPARRLLSDFLRHDLGLTGTHVGCEHGVCGACTVLVDGQPMRSCLL